MTNVLPQTFGTRHNKSSLLGRAALTSLPTKCVHRFDMWLWIFSVVFVLCAAGAYWYRKRSPFSLESVRPPGPRVFEQRERDRVLKQGREQTTNNNTVQIVQILPKVRNVVFYRRRQNTFKQKLVVKSARKRRALLDLASAKQNIILQLISEIQRLDDKTKGSLVLFSFVPHF